MVMRALLYSGLVLARAVNPTHYGDPDGGCMSDEQPVQVTGLAGDFCSPDCKSKACPTDLPAGDTATPACILKGATGNDKKCALQCDPTGPTTQCGNGSCQPISGTGICTYGAPPTPPPAPTPPPTPIPAPTPIPPGGAGWFRLPFEETLIGGVGAFGNTLYMTTTSGSAQSSILKSKDGASTFQKVNTSTAASKGLAWLAVAAASDDHAIATGLVEEYYTNDGFTFHNSIGPSLVNEKVDCAKVIPGRGPLNQFQFGIAGKFGGVNGVGVSSTGGVEYQPYGPPESQLNSTKFSVRRADFPSDSTWYATFGSFPAPPPAPARFDAQGRKVRVKEHHLTPTHTLEVEVESGRTSWRHHFDFGEKKFKFKAGADSGYASAIAKTTDKGATWKIVYQDTELGYMMNDISCINTEHCVAVAEGATGAIILTTTDGGTSWSKFQAEDHQALSQFSAEAHFFQSLDGGKNWTKKIMPGMLPMALTMTSPTNGYSSGFFFGTGSSMTLAKFTPTAPTMPPTPPPSPPRPGQTRYGDPHDGACESGEVSTSVTGATGAFCAPQCIGTGILAHCPTDHLPLNTSATPACCISDSITGEHLCGLECRNDTECPKKATCKQLGGAALCTYDDSGPTPAPTPPTPPTPAPPTPVPGSTHYGNPNLFPCQADEEIVNISIIPGSSICAPKCQKEGLKQICPSDVPGGVTAKPQCALKDGHTHYCDLHCETDVECGGGKGGLHKHAHCLYIGSVGIGYCYYDNSTTVAAVNHSRYNYRYNATTTGQQYVYEPAMIVGHSHSAF